MLFDTVLAFDHVQHRILIIANARITADDDLESLYQFACAKIEFLERELEREPVACAPAQRPARSTLHVEPRRRSTSRRRCARAKEHIAAGDIYQVVLSQRFEAEVDGRSVHGLPRAAAREPVALHVFHPHGRRVGRRLVARDAGARRRVARRDASDRRHAAARPHRRGGPAAGRGAEAQREGARRARDAGRSRAQRRRPRLRVRHGARAAVHGARALLARHAPDVDRRRASWPTIAIGSTRWSSCFPAGTVSGAPKVRAMEIIRSSSRRGAASTPARSATSTSPATSTSASRSARSSWRTARPTCRPAPAS